MKRILILLLLTISLVDANTYVFWVDNPEMTKMYSLVFEAIKDIFGSEDYYWLLKLIFLMGGFFTLALGVFQGFGKGMQGVLQEYFKYIATGVILLTLVFSGSSTLLIKSKTLGSFCATDGKQTTQTTVSDFPVILGVSFNFINQMGSYMTDAVEKDYTTVNTNESMSMSNGGYIHSVRDALKLLEIDLSDSNSTDETFTLKNFFSQCMIIPFSSKGGDGERELAKLKSSSNIFEYLNKLYITSPKNIGGILSTDYTLNINGDIHSCGEYYEDAKPRLEKYIDTVRCSTKLGEDAASLIMGGSPNVSNFDEMTIQAGLVSTLRETTQHTGIGVSGVSYASGKSKSEMVQTNIANGVYMSKMLPMLQMTLRIILYAFFPFVFIVVLFPGGLRVLGQYTKSLVWVELWTPVAAVLNMFLNFRASSSNEDIYGGSGLTLLSSISMMQDTAIVAGMAGYLYLMVPGLTWAFISGSAMMLETLAHGIAAHMTKNIRTESMNLDAGMIAKTQEASARSGKDLSMAEMQHYEAIQSGRVEGAKLGIEMNAKDGMNTIADMEAARTQQGISKYVNTAEATGIHGAAQGALLGEKESMKNRSDIKTINGLTKAQIEDSTEMDSRKDRGAIKANVEDNFSEDTYKNEQHQNNTETIINSKLHSEIGREAQVDTKVMAERFSLATTNALEANGGIDTIYKMSENDAIAARITNASNKQQKTEGLTEDVRAHLEAESASQKAGTIIGTRDQGGYNQTYAAATVKGRKTRIALDAINRKEANGVTESKEAIAKAQTAETGLYNADVKNKSMLIRKATIGANQEAVTNALGKINQVRSNQITAEEQEQQRIAGITTTDLADAAMTGTRINVSTMAAKRDLADAMGVSVEKMTDGDIIGNKVYAYNEKTHSFQETSYGRDENGNLVMTEREVTVAGMTEYKDQLRDIYVNSLGAEYKTTLEKQLGIQEELAKYMMTMSTLGMPIGLINKRLTRKAKMNSQVSRVAELLKEAEEGKANAVRETQSKIDEIKKDKALLSDEFEKNKRDLSKQKNKKKDVSRRLAQIEKDFQDLNDDIKRLIKNGDYAEAKIKRAKRKALSKEMNSLNKKMIKIKNSIETIYNNKNKLIEKSSEIKSKLNSLYDDNKRLSSEYFDSPESESINRELKGLKKQLGKNKEYSKILKDVKFLDSKTLGKLVDIDTSLGMLEYDPKAVSKILSNGKSKTISKIRDVFNPQQLKAWNSIVLDMSKSGAVSAKSLVKMTPHQLFVAVGVYLAETRTNISETRVGAIGDGFGAGGDTLLVRTKYAALSTINSVERALSMIGIGDYTQSDYMNGEDILSRQYTSELVPSYNKQMAVMSVVGKKLTGEIATESWKKTANFTEMTDGERMIYDFISKMDSAVAAQVALSVGTVGYEGASAFFTSENTGVNRMNDASKRIGSIGKEEFEKVLMEMKRANDESS